MKLQLTVSQTLLVQMTTQANSDASTAGCHGPMRSQYKAAIMYFLNIILWFTKFLVSIYDQISNLENQKFSNREFDVILCFKQCHSSVQCNI